MEKALRLESYESRCTAEPHECRRCHECVRSPYAHARGYIEDRSAMRFNWSELYQDLPCGVFIDLGMLDIETHKGFRRR